MEPNRSKDSILSEFQKFYSEEVFRTVIWANIREPLRYRLTDTGLIVAKRAMWEFHEVAVNPLSYNITLLIKLNRTLTFPWHLSDKTFSTVCHYDAVKLQISDGDLNCFLTAPLN